MKPKLNISRAIIVHGSEGSPDINWFPWLREELGALGITCVCPQFPTPEKQSLINWLDVLDEKVGKLSQGDVLIGHSTGAIFSLNVVNRLSHPIYATFLVAGFAGKLGNEKYDGLNSTFLETKFDWQKIKKNAGTLFIYSGSNDPYVPPERGPELAKLLGAKLTTIPNAGHINSEFGYTKFDVLLEDLKSLSRMRDVRVGVTDN